MRLLRAPRLRGPREPLCGGDPRPSRAHAVLTKCPAATKEGGKRYVYFIKGI